MRDALAYTPIPASYGPKLAAKWRTQGTHFTIDGVCGCGPANHLSGPQWATRDGIEYREPTRNAHI